jgi:hypothetical protein
LENIREQRPVRRQVILMLEGFEAVKMEEIVLQLHRPVPDRRQQKNGVLFPETLFVNPSIPVHSHTQVAHYHRVRATWNQAGSTFQAQPIQRL